MTHLRLSDIYLGVNDGKKEALYKQDFEKYFDIFNLGGHKTTSLAELIALLEKAIGRKAIIEELPEQKGDMPMTYADITKAEQYLDYHPQTSIEIGIPKFVKWYQEYTQTQKSFLSTLIPARHE